MNKQNDLATKGDLEREISRLREDMIIKKAELLKSVYVVGHILFLPAAVSILAILSFIK